MILVCNLLLCAQLILHCIMPTIANLQFCALFAKYIDLFVDELRVQSMVGANY